MYKNKALFISLMKLSTYEEILITCDYRKLQKSLN